MSIEQDILKIKELAEEHKNAAPNMLKLFVDDLPGCDLEASSLPELFVKIGEAYGCFEDETLDAAYNDDPSAGLDGSSLRERLEK